MDNTQEQTLNVIPTGVFKEILAPFLDITSLVKMSKLSKQFSNTFNPQSQNQTSISLLNWLKGHSDLDPDLKSQLLEQNSDENQFSICDLREILTKNKFLQSLGEEGMFYLDPEVLERELSDELDVKKSLKNLEVIKKVYEDQNFMTGSFVRPDQKWLENPVKKAVLEMKIDFDNGGGILENIVREGWNETSVQMVNILQNNDKFEEIGYQSVDKFFNMQNTEDPVAIASCVTVNNFDESKTNHGFDASIMNINQKQFSILLYQQDQTSTKGKTLEYSQNPDGRTEIESKIRRADRILGEYNYQESNFVDEVNWAKDFPQFVFTGNKALDLGTEMDAGSMDAVQKLFSNQKIAKQFFEDEPIKDEDDENDKSDEEDEIVKSDAELIQLSFEFKDKGNQQFKEGNNQYTKLIYEDGIENIELIRNPTDYSRQLAIILYQNFSLSCLKIGEFQQSIEKCSSALSIDQTSVKALYIRSQAYQGVKLFEQAINDIKAAIKLEPNDRGLRAFFHKLKIQKQKEAQKQMDSMLALFSEGNLYDEKDENDEKIDG